MRTSEIVLVGYSTRPRPDAADFFPEFEGRKGTKDEVLIEAQIAEKKKRFEVSMMDKPYLGQLDMVYMAVASSTNKDKHVYFNLEEMPDTRLLGPKLADTLHSWFGDDFDQDTGVCTGAPVRFVGFNVRRFAKLLGLENAEANSMILPFELWYNADYRDVFEMVLPQPECAELSLNTVIQRFGITMPEQMDFEPGDDAQLDALVAAECLTRLNIFPFANVPLQRIARSLREDVGIPTAANGTPLMEPEHMSTSKTKSGKSKKPTAKKSSKSKSKKSKAKA